MKNTTLCRCTDTCHRVSKFDENVSKLFYHLVGHFYYEVKKNDAIIADFKRR